MSKQKNYANKKKQTKEMENAPSVAAVVARRVGAPLDLAQRGAALPNARAPPPLALHAFSRARSLPLAHLRDRAPKRRVRRAAAAAEDGPDHERLRRRHEAARAAGVARTGARAGARAAEHHGFDGKAVDVELRSAGRGARNAEVVPRPGHERDAQPRARHALVGASLHG